MANSEVLPLAPDTEITPKTGVRTEPTEVGPFLQGTVFVRLMDVTGDASLDVEVLKSPYGYEAAEHWATGETASGLDTAGMHSIPVSHFGNFLRLGLSVDGETDEAVELQAWFVGKG